MLFRDIAPKDLSKKSVLSAAKEIATAFIAALLFWFALSFILNTAKPLNVVTSCSMLPDIQRGDLVIVQGGEISAPQITVPANSSRVEIFSAKGACTRKYDSGKAIVIPCTTGLTFGGQTINASKQNDIIVYESHIPGLDLIIHRVLAKASIGGKEFYITKGDNNNAADQEMFLQGRLVPKEDSHGKVILRIPFAGYVKLLLFGQLQAPPGCEYVTTQNP